MKKPKETFTLVRSTKTIVFSEPYIGREGEIRDGSSFLDGTDFRCIRLKSGRYLLAPVGSLDTLIVADLSVLGITE